MMNATQIRVGHILKIEGGIFRVLKVQHITPGKGNAQVQADLRNLKTGIKTNMRFRSVEAVDNVKTDERDMVFMYEDGTAYHFMDPESGEQQALSADLLADLLPYVKPEATISVLSHEGTPISIRLPQKMQFTVTACDPPSKGMAGALKDATVDTNASFKVPLFIKPGDTIVIETETGNYLEKG